MFRVVLTGGPGSGKTTVLELLKEAGHTVRDDAPRSIIQERKRAGLPPRPDQGAFARQILAREVASFNRGGSSPVFYERGVADAASFLLAAGEIDEAQATSLVQRYPYDAVCLFPPWAEIYVVDEERDHTFEHAQQVYESTRRWYLTHYPKVVEVPQASPRARLACVLDVVS